MGRGSEDTPYIKIDSPSSGFGPIPLGKGVAYVYYSIDTQPKAIRLTQ